MTRVAVLDDYQRRTAEFADWGRLPGEVVFIAEHVDGPDLIERLAGFDVVVATRERTAFPRAVLEQLPDLRLLVTTGMSNASIDLDAAAEREITVCGTTSLSANTTELTWAILLAAVKHIPEQDREMRTGHWQRQVAGDLANQRLGLIGLGRLGRAMVPIAHAFGMQVRAWSQNLTPEQAAEAGVEYASLESLLRTSDMVSIHLKLSERSRGLLGTAELGLLRPGAVLVNTSRGPIIDETALIDVLRAGRITAALDVYDIEPLPAGHPLTTLENVVLSPHLGYATENNFRVYYPQVVEDIEAYLRGEPIRRLE